MLFYAQFCVVQFIQLHTIYTYRYEYGWSLCLSLRLYVDDAMTPHSIFTLIQFAIGSLMDDYLGPVG